MKLFLLTLSLCLSCALAQENPAPRREGFERRGGPGGRGGFSIGMRMLDANTDGELSDDEIDAAPAALAKLDKDADGRITMEELRAAMPQGPRGGRPEFDRERRGPEGGGNTSAADDTVKTFMSFDSNGDGKLSKEEVPERMQGIFARGDADRDGFLTPDEIRKAVAAQAPPANGPGRRGGPEGGPPRDMNFIRFDPILSSIDTDKDGSLSKEEIREAAKSIRKLDRNGDGKITREEAMPQMMMRREGRA